MKDNQKIEGDLSCPYSIMADNKLECESSLNAKKVEDFLVYVNGECNCENYRACEFYSEKPKKDEGTFSHEGTLEKNIHSDKDYFE